MKFATLCILTVQVSNLKLIGSILGVMAKLQKLVKINNF